MRPPRYELGADAQEASNYPGLGRVRQSHAGGMVECVCAGGCRPTRSAYDREDQMLFIDLTSSRRDMDVQWLDAVAKRHKGDDAIDAAFA